MSSDNVVIIIQARLGSSRLPGKILRDLNGYPVLQHVLERCAAILGRSCVVCAGVDLLSEVSVKSLVESLGIEFFGGSEQDVLERYYYAAKARGAEWVVRVTSDCPLLDPDVCRELIRKTIESGADYGITHGWPHGLDCEIVKFALLEQAHLQSTLAKDREHVTLWIKGREDMNKFQFTPNEKIAGLNDFRWVLDYEEDYQFLQRLFEQLNIQPTVWPTTGEVISYLRSHPELIVINRQRISDWAAHNKEIMRTADKK